MSTTVAENEHPLIEAQKLGRLAAFRAGPIHPVAVAGIKRTAMAREIAQLRAAHEAARCIQLPCRVGNVEAPVSRSRHVVLRLGADDNEQKAGKTCRRKTESH
jgi:hypothetical protein